MKTLDRLLVTLVFVASPLAFANARGRAQDSAPTVKLSVKLVIVEGASPTYYPLNDDEKAGSGGAVLYGFRRLPGRPSRVSGLIEFLSVSFRREGSGARCSVFVHGKDLDLPEGGKVADFSLGEGAEYRVTRLADYGIEPVRVGLVRRAAVELAPPRVENRTTAVEVVAVRVLEKELKFELVLRNVSQKSVRAVEVDEYRGWQRKGGPPHFDWKGRPPLKPSEEWKVVLEVGWNFEVSEEGHTPRPADRVVIGAVVFSDGTFEGDTSFVARTLAFVAGRDRQAARVLELMREWGEAPDAASLPGLGPRLEALECAAEWSEVVALTERFQMVYGRQSDEIKSSYEEGMTWQRTRALREWQGFQSAALKAGDPLALASHLRGWRRRYEQQLAPTPEPGPPPAARGPARPHPENER